MMLTERAREGRNAMIRNRQRHLRAARLGASHCFKVIQESRVGLQDDQEESRDRICRWRQILVPASSPKELVLVL